MAFPYPFELETGGTVADRADGAFIAGCLGLLARGLIELAFEDDGRARGADALWVKRGVASQLPQPRMETALNGRAVRSPADRSARVGPAWTSLMIRDRSAASGMGRSTPTRLPPLTR